MERIETVSCQLCQDLTRSYSIIREKRLSQESRRLRFDWDTRQGVDLLEDRRLKGLLLAGFDVSLTLISRTVVVRG